MSKDTETGPPPAPGGPEADNVPTTEQTKDENEAEDTVVFSTYVCRSITAGRLHPGNIMEGSSLAAINLPPVEYPLFESLPKNVVEEGRLSNLQLEAVLYACQRHQILLPFRFPTGPNQNAIMADTANHRLPYIKAHCTRAGFFIGDGAGVGKGRQISGIILENWARGGKKHVWFSTSSDLRLDAERDLRDLGCFIKVINGAQELERETRAVGLAQEFKEGVLFCTYHTLTRPNRVKQIMEWCGADFEGCIVFDESHKAKNFTVGEKAGSKVSEAATHLQRVLPMARVVYCSATGATDVKNLGFMERLGLWGPGLSFPTFENFLEDISRRGLGALEMIAMELKMGGVYVSRSLSFQDCEFEILQTSLTLEQMTLYNRYADLWKNIRQCVESAIERGVGSGRAMSAYWGANQRFFMQLCIALKVDRVVAEAKEALGNGCCVVIGLQTTGEASLDREMGKGPNSAPVDFVSVTKEIVVRYLTVSFPTMIQPSNGEPARMDPTATYQRAQLLDIANSLPALPTSLDAIIDSLGGPSAVAEMTGRRGRMVRVGKSSSFRYESRGDGEEDIENVNIREKERFMRGDKLVAVISEAASTGISLHAASRAQNQRRRVHITIELPWSADRAIQQLGRTHRSDQTSAPLYKLVVCDLPGERRCAVAVASRLQSLGALTRGDRKAASGFDLSLFNIDTKYGRQALKAMYESITYRQLQMSVPIETVATLLQEYGRPGEAQTIDVFLDTLQVAIDYMGVADTDNGAKDAKGGIKKFLNRILGMPVAQQYMLYGYFTAILRGMIDAARKDGSYNEGVVDLWGERVEFTSRTPIYKDPSTGVSTWHYQIGIDRGVSFESALTKLKAAGEENAGFYLAKQVFFGKLQLVLAIRRGPKSSSYRVFRPNTGLALEDMTRESLSARFSKVEPEKIQEMWTSQYEEALTQCSHGPSCKNGRGCVIGLRKNTVHVVNGGVVPLWGALESTISAVSGRLTESDKSIKVVRVEATSGERLVGVHLPHVAHLAFKQYLETLAMINANTTRRQLTEPEAPFQAAALAKALRPPTTMLTFFQKATPTPETTPKPKPQRENSISSSQSGSTQQSSTTANHEKPTAPTSSNPSNGGAQSTLTSASQPIKQPISRQSSTPSSRGRGGGAKRSVSQRAGGGVMGMMVSAAKKMREQYEALDLDNPVKVTEEPDGTLLIDD